jgi:hypothetical protein
MHAGYQEPVASQPLVAVRVVPACPQRPGIALVAPRLPGFVELIEIGGAEEDCTRSDGRAIASNNPSVLGYQSTW